MATTGYIDSAVSKYGGKLRATWEVVERNAEENTSVITWKVEVINKKVSTGDFAVKFDTTTMFRLTHAYPMFANNALVLDTEYEWSPNYVDESDCKNTYTVYHNADGSGSFQMTFETNIDSYSGKTRLITKTFELDPFPKAATVSSTNAYIGDNIDITIGKPSASTAFSYDLTYTFGTLSGTIATKTQLSTISWTIPTSFYNQMTNEASKTGVITCKTYRNNVLEGQSTCNFIAMINPDAVAPILTPTVRDIKEETIALTGDSNKIIRHLSLAEFAVNAVANQGATITGYSVQCGSRKLIGLANGVIDNVESGTFVFTATDSRGFTTEKTITIPCIEYVKPTCSQDIKISMSEDEQGAEAIAMISGNYFAGSFGTARNTIKIEMRNTQADGSMGDWVDLTPLLANVNSDNTYDMEFRISGLTYAQTYTFQSRITDRFYTVQTAQYTSRVLPVYDWSKEDFNLNVPFNINGQTVLRHNKEANNTVLSASGGNIYLRPNGTDSTYGETVFHSDGSVSFSGEVDFSEAMPDYVIETGTEAMGSNGTWHWEKWLSGKAVCWGKRNFGNMAITTAWGGLYRSATQTQALPSGLFNDVPDVINISMIDASYGGWVCKHEETAPSANNTGAFIYVRPASATTTTTRTHLGFYVVGKWK